MESAQGAIIPIGLIPSYICNIYKAIISIDSVQGALKIIGLIPIIFFTGCTAIISRQSDLGSLSPIGLIPSNLLQFSLTNNLQNILLRTTVNWLLYPITNMILNIKYWRAIFFPKLKTLIYELICVKMIFIHQPSKMTMEPSQWGNFCATRTESTTPLIKKEENIGEYKTFWTAPLCSCFYFEEIEGVSRYTKWDP